MALILARLLSTTTTSGRSSQVSCGPFCHPLAVSQHVRAHFVEQLGCATLTISVRFSNERTDYFRGTEYFGLITLLSRVFRVHSVRFFLRACGISAAWLPSVPLAGCSLFTCVCSLYTCACCARCGGGGGSFFARFLASSMSPNAAALPLLTSLTYYLSCGALGVYA